MTNAVTGQKGQSLCQIVPMTEKSFNRDLGLIRELSELSKALGRAKAVSRLKALISILERYASKIASLPENARVAVLRAMPNKTKKVVIS